MTRYSYFCVLLIAILVVDNVLALRHTELRRRRSAGAAAQSSSSASSGSFSTGGSTLPQTSPAQPCIPPYIKPEPTLAVPPSRYAGEFPGDKPHHAGNVPLPDGSVLPKDNVPNLPPYQQNVPAPAPLGTIPPIGQVPNFPPNYQPNVPSPSGTIPSVGQVPNFPTSYQPNGPSPGANISPYYPTNAPSAGYPAGPQSGSHSASQSGSFGGPSGSGSGSGSYSDSGVYTVNLENGDIPDNIAFPEVQVPDWFKQFMQASQQGIPYNPFPMYGTPMGFGGFGGAGAGSFAGSSSFAGAGNGLGSRVGGYPQAGHSGFPQTGYPTYPTSGYSGYQPMAYPQSAYPSYPTYPTKPAFAQPSAYPQQPQMSFKHEADNEVGSRFGFKPSVKEDEGTVDAPNGIQVSAKAAGERGSFSSSSTSIDSNGKATYQVKSGKF